MTIAPVYARGVLKTVSIALETTFGTQATSSAQLLRRNGADLNLNTSPIESQEINPAAQMRDMRLGPRQVQGTLSGQLSPASYSMIWAALLRSSFVSGTVKSGITDSTATIDPSTGRLTLTSAASAFLAGNALKIGDICRVTGLTGGPAADNAENLRIVALSNNAITFAPPPGAAVGWTTGETDTVTVVGKKLIIANNVANQVFQSFTMEQWYGDVSVSELFTGVTFSQASFNIPASGFATFQASMLGQQMTLGAAQIYPSATAATTTTSLTAAGGRVSYAGTDMAIITGMNIQLSVDTQGDPVVGSQIIPYIFQGMISVRGSLTALMINDTMTADYLAETEVQIALSLTTAPGPGADFISIFLPRVKLSQATRTDSPRAITRNYSFVALEQIAGGAGQVFDDTTITMQDSQTS